MSGEVQQRADIDTLLIPDAGPLITLAYADALDLLLMPGWQVSIVDMVLHEVTRNTTPTSEKIERWVLSQSLPVVQTQIHRSYRERLLASETPIPTSNLGELAIQEAMHRFATDMAFKQGVFLFEDHKIARTGFVVPTNCLKVTTRSFLTLLEQKGWLDSAFEIERRAISAGRSFSKLRFPN
jgi:hypothetical protein